MSEYKVVAVANGISTPVSGKPIYDVDKAVEIAENFYEEALKGRVEGRVEVVKVEETVVKEFEETSPEKHEKQKRDIEFEDFFEGE